MSNERDIDQLKDLQQLFAQLPLDKNPSANDAINHFIQTHQEDIDSILFNAINDYYKDDNYISSKQFLIEYLSSQYNRLIKPVDNPYKEKEEFIKLTLNKLLHKVEQLSSRLRISDGYFFNFVPTIAWNGQIYIENTHWNNSLLTEVEGGEVKIAAAKQVNYTPPNYTRANVGAVERKDSGYQITTSLHADLKAPSINENKLTPIEKNKIIFYAIDKACANISHQILVKPYSFIVMNMTSINYYIACSFKLKCLMTKPLSPSRTMIYNVDGIEFTAVLIDVSGNKLYQHLHSRLLFINISKHTKNDKLDEVSLYEEIQKDLFNLILQEELDKNPLTILGGQDQLPLPFLYKLIFSHINNRPKNVLDIIRLQSIFYHNHPRYLSVKKIIHFSQFYYSHRALFNGLYDSFDIAASAFKQNVQHWFGTKSEELSPLNVEIDIDQIFNTFVLEELFSKEKYLDIESRSINIPFWIIFSDRQSGVKKTWNEQVSCIIKKEADGFYCRIELSEKVLLRFLKGINWNNDSFPGEVKKNSSSFNPLLALARNTSSDQLFEFIQEDSQKKQNYPLTSNGYLFAEHKSDSQSNDEWRIRIPSGTNDLKHDYRILSDIIDLIHENCFYEYQYNAMQEFSALIEKMLGTAADVSIEGTNQFYKIDLTHAPIMNTKFGRINVTIDFFEPITLTDNALRSSVKFTYELDAIIQKNKKDGLYLECAFDVLFRFSLQKPILNALEALNNHWSFLLPSQAVPADTKELFQPIELPPASYTEQKVKLILNVPIKQMSKVGSRSQYWSIEMDLFKWFEIKNKNITMHHDGIMQTIVIGLKELIRSFKETTNTDECKNEFEESAHLILEKIWNSFNEFKAKIKTLDEYKQSMQKYNNEKTATVKPPPPPASLFFNSASDKDTPPTLYIKDERFAVDRCNIALR
jgi:hypothetical protein